MEACISTRAQSKPPPAGVGDRGIEWQVQHKSRENGCRQYSGGFGHGSKKHDTALTEIIGLRREKPGLRRRRTDIQ